MPGVGTQFASYRIEGVLGRGGMGVVYRATELGLERPVALKLIAPELAGDTAFRESFLRESRLAASIDHPGILPVYAAGEAEGELYLANRFVDGQDLRTVIVGGPLSPERALSIVGQVADALDAAHARGLVHRDVKPANVLVDGAGHDPQDEQPGLVLGIVRSFLSPVISAPPHQRDRGAPPRT